MIMYVACGKIIIEDFSDDVAKIRMNKNGKLELNLFRAV